MFYCIIVLMWKRLYNLRVGGWGGGSEGIERESRNWPHFPGRKWAPCGLCKSCDFWHVCLWGSKAQEVHGRPPTARNAQQMFSTFHVRINPVMWTTKKQSFPIQLSLFQHKTTHCSILTTLIVISARRQFQSNSVLSIFLSLPLISLCVYTPLFHYLKYKPVPAIELLLKFAQW